MIIAATQWIFTESKYKNGSWTYLDWLVYMYLHISITNIYSGYPDFYIYGSGVELVCLHHKKHNGLAWNTYFASDWNLNSCGKWSFRTMLLKKCVLNYSADKCNLKQSLITCHFTSNCHCNEFWNIINSIDFEVIFIGVRDS